MEWRTLALYLEKKGKWERMEWRTLALYLEKKGKWERMEWRTSERDMMKIRGLEISPIILFTNSRKAVL